MKEYIETGYEKELKKILEDRNNKVILINGEFGDGKTTLLHNVLKIGSFEERKTINNFLKLKKKKNLELKVYGEYVEENYVDYLYNILKSKTNLIEKIATFIKNNFMLLLWSFIILSLFFFKTLFLEYLNYLTINSKFLLLYLFFMALILVYLKSNIENKFKKTYINKIKYKKKNLKKYN